MAEFTEDFEGGADGVTVTAPGTTAFSGLTGSSAMTHSTLRSILGTTSLRILNPSGTMTLYQTISPARTVSYLRVYWFPASLTTGNANVLMTETGATSQSAIQAAAGGVLRLRDGTTTIATSALTIQAGQWYRLELFADYIAGTQTARIFAGANVHGTVPDDTMTGSLTTGTYNRAAIGHSTAVTYDHFWDCYAEDPSGWIGPIDTSGGVGGHLQLEDASGNYLLEDGSGVLLNEDYIAPSALSASDNFNRASLGSNWITTATPVTLDGAQVLGSTAQNGERWSQSVSQSLGAVFAQATFKGGTLIGPAVAMPGFADASTFSSTGSWYTLRVTGTGLALVQKDNLAGSYTALTTTSMTINSGDVIRLEYDGTTLNGYVNGALQITATPGSPLSIASQPYVGFGHGASGQTGTALMDDWSGGDTVFTVPSSPAVDITDFFLVL